MGSVYSYDSLELGHCISVEFLDTSLNKEFGIGGHNRTIARITEPELVAQIFDGFYLKTRIT